jgi:carboxylesterase type B
MYGIHCSASLLTSILILFATLVPLTAAYEAPIIKLDYVTLQGAYSSTYNITYYRKIPFGASTAGINRFRAPQPPKPITNGTYDTDQDFDMCPCRTVNGTEDCLYLGLYSRPWTNPHAKRPVVVVFYGGGFIRGSASFGIPPSAYPLLNVSGLNDYITVYPNYRTNALGFLPGRKIKECETCDLNPGLLDQQAALRWVQRYIHHFGGDPRNVTIQGQSAGGGSVVAQNIANAGRTTPPLFQKALASSPYWPKTYDYNSKEAEAIYERFVSLTGCGDAEDSVECIKNIDIQRIRDAALTMSNDHIYNTSSFTWAPVVDRDFIQTTLTEAIKRGRMNADFAMSTFNAHEGESFTPPGFSGSDTGSDGFNSSPASFERWLRGFMPMFSSALIDEVRELYPASGSEETLEYNSTVIRAGLIYRDAVLACPAYWTAKAGKREGYLAEYIISPAKHGSDTTFVSFFLI